MLELKTIQVGEAVRYPLIVKEFGYEVEGTYYDYYFGLSIPLNFPEDVENYVAIKNHCGMETAYIKIEWVSEFLIYQQKLNKKQSPFSPLENLPVTIVFE